MASKEAAMMKSLFAGFDQAYGTHGKPSAKLGVIKQEIKATALTLKGEVTLELWDEHLQGNKPLGIIPILRNNNCNFAAIDIDKYDINHRELLEELSRQGFFFPVTQSKSGGGHVWIFFKEEVNAKEAIAGLKKIAARIGHGGSETFPKQSGVLWDRGDLGNWINMPYFGTERAGIKPSGAEMTLIDFIANAEKSRVSLVDFNALINTDKRSSKKSANGHGHLLNLSDGPPCLEFLVTSGFPDGTRNNGLFALGVYVRKKYGDDWKNKLSEFNSAVMKPPLTFDEVAMVAKSLEKKDYNYTCQSSPLCQHCNSSLCRTRPHGISNSSDYPTITGVSVLSIEPAIWFVEIGDHKLELTTEEFQEYRRFTRVCLDRLHIAYKTLKQTTWTDMIVSALVDMIEIQAPVDLGEQGEFMEHLQDFLVNRHTGRRVEDLWMGRPWECVEEKRHYFRMRDLQAYLVREGSKLTRGKIANKIEKLGGGKGFFHIKGHGVNVWFVPSNQIQQEPEIDPPEFTAEKSVM